MINGWAGILLTFTSNLTIGKAPGKIWAKEKMFPTSASTRQYVEEYRALQDECNADRSCKSCCCATNRPQSGSGLCISAVNYITCPKNQGLKSNLSCLGGESRANLADDKRLMPGWAENQNWAWTAMFHLYPATPSLGWKVSGRVKERIRSCWPSLSMTCRWVAPHSILPVPVFNSAHDSYTCTRSAFSS